MKNATTIPTAILWLTTSQPPNAATITVASVLSMSIEGVKAEVTITACTFTSRLAALCSAKCWIFASVRLYAWATLTPASSSSNSEETIPSTVRVRRKATPERRANTTVIQIITGRTRKLTAARGKLSTTIAIRMPTSENTLPITCVMPWLSNWLIVWISFTRRDIKSPALFWSKKASGSDCILSKIWTRSCARNLWPIQPIRYTWPDCDASPTT